MYKKNIKPIQYEGKLLNQNNAIFPIRHISELTGVLTVTLRAWERRFGLLKPARTAKGHRLYSEADITRVKEILNLLNQGMAISQVRQVLDQKNNAKHPSVAADSIEDLQRQLLQTVMGLDVLAASQFIYDTGKNYPIAMVVERLVRPLKHRLSQTSGAIHQAAASSLVLAMQMFMARRLSHTHTKTESGKILFVGMQGEDLCLSYDLAWVMAAEAGIAVSALGYQLPLAALEELAASQQSKLIAIWADAEPHLGWENKLRDLTTKTTSKIYMGGELASRHQSFLASIAVNVLPLNMELTIKTLKDL